eukprot:s2557_g9.t1
MVAAWPWPLLLAWPLGSRGAFSETLCPSQPSRWSCGDCEFGESLCCKAWRLSRRLHDLDTSQHTVQLLSSSRVTPFYFEVNPYEFGIDDLERGLKFAEPSEVLELCLDFLRLPRASERVEQHLSRCSRAMLSLAKVADVLGRSNRSCAEESIRARYPLKLEDEALYEGLDEKRFYPGYSRFTDLVNRWKLFAMLANHSQICGNQPRHRCAVFNPWEPLACLKHHPLIQMWAPPCSGVIPKIPRRRSKVLKVARDWLGIFHDCSKGTPQNQPELTRRFECWGLPWGPLPGEDYFETISLLQAVSAATQRFVLVEAGSSNGYWSLKAAKAFRQQLPPEEASCDLILIDSEYPMAQTAAHLRENNIYDLCNVYLYQEPATASLLDRLLQAFGSINMIHVDIQSAELDLLKGSEHLSKVQALHVGTHSRDLHHNVREELLARGFAIDFDYSPDSFVRTAYGPVAFMDGLLAARQMEKADLI